MSTLHPAYAAALPLWSKVLDVLAGEERVKEQRTLYLPMLASQKEYNDPYARESYDNYLARADFYGAAQRTVQGLVGAIMSKEPAVEGVPDADLVDIQDAFGVNYESADALAMAQIEEAVSIGRYALLVDKGDDPNAKPYVLKFPAASVTNWVTSEIGGRSTLTRVVIEQTVTEPDTSDPMGIKEKETKQKLVLCLGDVPERWADVEGFEGFAGAPSDVPIYWQEVWREDKDAKGAASWGTQPYALNVPTKRGGRFWAEIPCDIVNAVGGIRADVEQPPMLALCNKILALYRGSADLEWGRHMVAIPQPYITGYQPADEGERLVMGCGSAWVLPDPGASVGFLEFAGAGLGHIAEGQKDKKSEAAVLGARMLEEQPNGVEALGTVKLRQAGDRSVLKTIAHNVSQAMTRAVQRYLSWEYPRFETVESLREVSYELACDFDASKLDPAELAAMTQALQEGSMSWETFAFNMRRGEMLPPGVTDDEERDRIQKGAPGRSRKDEAAMLQVDVREGRISKDTYLQSLARLGYLDGVDINAESLKVYEDKVMAAELQMQAFQQAGGNFGGSATPGTFGEGVVAATTADEGEPDSAPDDGETSIS